MENKSNEHLIITQAEVEANKQNYDKKTTKFTEELKTMLTANTYQINSLKSLPTQKDSQNPSDPNTVVPANRRASPLDGGKYTKNWWYAESHT